MKKKKCVQESETRCPFLLGQRVLLNDVEIGVVGPVKGTPSDMRGNPENFPNTNTHVWVYSVAKGYESYYAIHNVKPLPGGQL